MKCVWIVLMLVQIGTSHQQTIPPHNRRCYCNALQTRDIRELLQADSDKLTRQHEEVMAALKAISSTNGSDEKRILLIQQELTRFHSELQEMQVMYNELSTKYNTQNTKLAELQVKDDAQNTKLTSLQTKYNTQNTTLSDLQTTYNTQNTKLADLQVKYDSRLQSYNATVRTLQTTLQNSLTSQDAIIKTIQGDKGAVFTRWGRRDCPANISTMVYSGTAGGSYFTHTGAAAEYVCMPNDPIWGPHKDLVYVESVGYIYGAEYQGSLHLFGTPNYAEDVPCAVCLGTQHTASLMIPGRTQCYPGWTEVYHGDLVSGYHGYAAASQYICLDGDPQVVPGGGTHDDNGKLFYGVKAKCGSLPCPPYADGKFLSCVVCMK